MYLPTEDPEAAATFLAAVIPPAVVVVPVFNATDSALQCCRSIAEHTPPAVPLMVIDDASTEVGCREQLASACAQLGQGERRVVLMRRPSNHGFLENANLAFEISGRADVVLVNSDVVVGAHWYRGLRAAAEDSSLIATVTPLTNHGTILSLPDRNRSSHQLPRGLSLDEAAERVRLGSRRLRPYLPTAIGHCTYFRRLALDAVGSFDPAFGRGYEEEVDWSQRARAMGFVHVAADDVFVFHQGGASFGSSAELEETKRQHGTMIAARYPYYHPEVKALEADRSSPLAAALLAGRRSLQGLHLVVDGMCLGPVVSGTQVGLLEFTRELAGRDRVREIDVLVPPTVPDYVNASVGDLANVRLIPSSVGDQPRGERADVALRLYQFTNLAELRWLRLQAERLVVLQLDLIAYNDPAYFANHAEWAGYRRVQSLALATADGIGFISEVVQRQAAAQGLLRAGVTSRVISFGTDHPPGEPLSEGAPAQFHGLRPGFLLQLGVSFHHKNRPWSLRLLKQLAELGWDGDLVLAGPEPNCGSSRPEERRWLQAAPELAGRVIDTGSVSAEEKDWLYRNAALVLYPTLSEGFGLIPFEAAAYGVPCLSTRQTSLDELLPAGIPTLADLGLEAAAQQVLHLIRQPAAGQALVAAIEERAASLSWQAAGAQLEELAWEVSGAPAAAIVAVETPDGLADLTGGGATGLVSATLSRAGAIGRDSPWMRGFILPPNTARGRGARRLYHRLRRQLTG